MAFPTNQETAATAVKLLLDMARSLRSDTARYIAQCDSGVLNLHDVAGAFMARHLSWAKTEIVILSSVTGIYDALVDALPNKFADAAAAQTAVSSVATAISDMIDFLEANLPVDASRRILSLILSDDGSGTLTQRTITSGAQLDAFRAQLVSFRDAFEA